MKWRPIRELGGRQFSGGWVLFSFKTGSGRYMDEFRLRKGWNEEKEKEDFGWFDASNNFIDSKDISNCFSYFLDEPIPEFPQPQKLEGVMRWRPISELSDEQRDGRWWVFGWPNKDEKDESVYQIMIWEEGEWFDDTGCIWRKGWLAPTEEGSFFLSEPLPPLAKSQKMEWYRFDQRIPSVGSEVLLTTLSKGRPVKIWIHKMEINILANALENPTLWYWMPIIPPEDI